MTTEQIIKQLNEVFIDVLDNPDLIITRETTANDVEEWDSLNHLMLVSQIEKTFHIKFAGGEVGRFKNVGEMCEAIRLKMQK